MPSIGSEIKTYLKTVALVTDLVGQGNNARIFPNNLKQGSSGPSIRYVLYQGESFESINGGKASVGQTRVQIDCYADSEDDADALMTVVDNALRPAGGFRGTMGNTYVNGINAEGTVDSGTDPPEPGSSKFRYWQSRDYQVTHSES